MSQVHCISQLQDGLFFVLTTVDNISPSLGFELLGRIVKILKDYCGVLDEETVGVPQAPSRTPSAPMHNVLLLLPRTCIFECIGRDSRNVSLQLRLNFVLVYELLDEILDFGVPQGTSTELLKAFIFCEPQEVDGSNALEQGLSALAKFSLGDSKVKSAAAAHKSVASRSSRNELFVDVLEVCARASCPPSRVSRAAAFARAPPSPLIVSRTCVLYLMARAISSVAASTANSSCAPS